MRYFLLGKVIDQLPLLCFSISIENLSLRSSLHHLTTSSQFLSSLFPLGQSKFSKSQFSTRLVVLPATSVNSVSQSRIEIFSLRRDMIFHLFLNDSLVKATFGSSVREKSIAPEEIENLEIVKTLLNGVKSFLRINFQLKWKS